jgi:hypothetical protein
MIRFPAFIFSFKDLKTESIYLQKPQSFEELQNIVATYITEYNHNRFQKKLNNCSPIEYREAAAA